MKVGDKVFVIDWGKQYSNFHSWIEGKKVSVFEWKTPIPDYSGTSYFWKVETKPVLTAKGLPRKDGKTEVVSRTPVFEDYMYEVREIIKHPSDDKNILLLSSTHTDKEWNKCFVQIGEDGVSVLSPEQYHKTADEAFKSLHHGKWSIGDNLKEFPKKLLKYIYDSDQRSQFGSGMTRATIKYPYIPAEYTKNGNPLCLGWEQSFDGGCSLEGKEVKSWHELKDFFPENRFE